MDNKNYISYFSFLFFSLCLIQFIFAQDKAEEWFNKATKASHPDDKIRYYQKSIELDPNIIEAYYNLAIVYKNKNKHEKALKALNKALNLSREQKDKELRLSILYELGICYKRINNYSKSLKMLENAKQLAKDKKIRAHVLYELGRVAVLVKDFDKALAQFNEGIKISGKNKKMFEMAIENAKKEALQSSVHKKDAEEWFKKAIESSNPDDKIQYYQKSIKLDPNFIEAHYNLAYLYKNKNDNEKAIEALSKALNLNREKKDEELMLSILYELGICFKRVNNYSKSIKMLENAKQLAKEKEILTHILYELGRVALLAKDFDNALAQFNEGIQVSSKNRELFQPAIEKTKKEKLLNSLYNDGMALLQQKKYDKAVEAFSKVIKLEPNYKDINIKLLEAQNQKLNKSDTTSTKSAAELLKEGNALFFNQDYKQALSKYKLLIKISPFNSKVYYNIGKCYEKIKNNTRAITAYQKALLLKSNFKDASVALNRIGGKPLDKHVKDANFIRGIDLFFQMNYNEAIKEYRKFLNKEPDNFQVLINIAFCYEQKRDFNSAIEHYQKALEINNDSVEATQGLARVLAKHKKNQLASLKKQIENDLDHERFLSANSEIKQYLQLNPNDSWALNKARAVKEVLEIQKKVKTSKEPLAERMNLYDVFFRTTRELTTEDSLISDSATNASSEPTQTDDKKLVFIYLIAGFLILLAGFLYIMLKK